MPSANVYDMDGNVVREEQLDSYVFGAPLNTAVLHQVVTAQLVNRRQGSASTRTRAQVSGGNSKPYRQKGTGRARQGSTRAPHFRGGGNVFGPKPHAYERNIPRKVKRLAIRSALSDKVANGRLLLMDELNFEAPSTRDMLALIEQLPLERHILVLMPERNENVLYSAHNIHRVKMGHVDSINVVEVLKYDHLLLTTASVEKLVARFGEAADDALQARRHPRVVWRREKHRAAASFGGATTTATATAKAEKAGKAESAAPAPKATRAKKAAPAEKPTAAAKKSAPADEGTPKRGRARSREE